MNRRFLDEIDLAKRDALVAFRMKSLKFKYVEQLYDYFLIDPLPGKQVVSSTVTEAVASMQHFLSRIANRQEPDLKMDPHDIRAWNRANSRYSLWAGDRRLRAYSENYLDPTTRRGKTAAFVQLEARLGQGRIDADAVQSAVLGYLNEFEKVCNLDVLGGYLEDDDLSAQKMYFIGRPKRPPHTAYYWRELALDRTSAEGTRLLPTAWSEWRKVDSISSGVLDDMIKPVFFNGRLYVVWCERQEKRAAASPGSPDTLSGDATGTRPFNYAVRIAYKKFDSSWSEPLQLLTTADFPGPVSSNATASSSFDVVVSRAADEAGSYLSIFLDLPGQSSTSAKFDAALNEVSPTAEQVKSLKDLRDKTHTGRVPSRPIEEKVIDPTPGTVTDPATGQVKDTTAGNIVDTFVLDKRFFTPAPQRYRTDEGSWFRTVDISIVPSVKDGVPSLKITVPNLITEHRPKTVLNYLLTVSQTDRFETTEYWTDDIQFIKVLPKFDVGGFEYTVSGPAVRSGVVQVELTMGLIVTTIRPLVPTAPLSHYKCDKLKATFTLRLNPAEPSTLAATKDQGISVDYLKPSAQDQPQFIRFGKAGSGKLESVQINTLVVKDLVNYAYAGLDTIFAQQGIITPEPTGTSSSLSAQDPFQGANGLYFWELFFHTPFLVAHRLVQEGRFAKARHWLNYIFDPSAMNLTDGWLFEPFKDPRHYDSESLPSPPRDGVSDPDEIASASPIRYKKAILFLYINSFIGQGDACYRELERDSINEAMQCYMQALSMLGVRPRGGQKLRWQAIHVGQTNAMNEPSAVSADHPFGKFFLPINQTLVQFWDRIDARLHNLRHSLTIDGKPMSLPAFDPPADPARLSRAATGAAGASVSPAGQPIETFPHYRFQVVLAKAYAASESLIQFGNALQAALERKDAAHLERLQQSQLIDLQQFTLQIQRDTIGAARASLDSLNSAQGAAAKRKKYYADLASTRNSGLETSALALRATGSTMTTGSHAVRAVGAALDLAPNIFGTSDGGMHYGAPAYAMADGALAVAEATTQSGYLIETAEQYRRRQEEWQQMADQANDEITQLATQVIAQKSLVSQYENQLSQIGMQHSQQRDMAEFMSSRFSSEELYFWMSSQLADLYAQAYDATVSVCQMAQSAWRWETGSFDPKVSYIRPGGWADRYAGLLKGEQLRLCLHRLENDFLGSSGRKLEIIHTVSLKQHGRFDALTAEVSRLANAKAIDSDTHEDGEDTAKVSFSLKADDFDQRYPGHILRQIAAVTITLPGVVGPYQDVRAILTQTQNEIVCSGGESPLKKTDLRPGQQVALSTGLDDSGLFALNFGDERYLPFEGTGAHSTWELAFPGAREQLPFLKSLTDVIVRLRYTALPGPSGHLP